MVVTRRCERGTCPSPARWMLDLHGQALLAVCATHAADDDGLRRLVPVEATIIAQARRWAA